MTLTRSTHRRRSLIAISATALAVIAVAAVLTTAGGDSVASADHSPPRFARGLNDLITAKMKETATPGAIVSISVVGQGHWQQTFGVENLSTGAEMEADRFTRIGSVTKTFTGETILRLVDEGKLALDDKVSKYQPQVLGVAGGGAEVITIRQLLNMSSGFFDFQEDEPFVKEASEQPDTAFDPKYVVGVAMKHPLYFTPGSSFHYSNTNTVLLGLIIQQVAGQTVADAFYQQLFGPLGMTHSGIPDRYNSSVPDPHPRGYYYATPAEYAARGVPRDETTWNPSWGWTAGAAISQVDDLMIWAKALGTGKLLKPATFAQQQQYVDVPGSTAKYGLAIFNFDGYIGHNGSLPGYTSFVAYSPTRKATIVVLTNLTTPSQSPADQIAALIIDRLAHT